MTHVFRFPESRILNPNCHTELLPSPTQVKIRFPATSAQLSLVADTRTNIRAILSGQSSKRLLVVGPCSIHNLHSAKEYAIRLRDLALQVKDQFVIVMRAYFEKPRTTTGWKGLLYDPHLDGSNDIIEGLYLSRQMLLDLAGLGVPAATEFLDPVTPLYFGDLVSWGSVGARTTASQIHRQMISALPIPTGFKNGTNGNVDIAINAILSASMAHGFIGLSEEGQAAIVHSPGNRDSHVVLRGAHTGPNYDRESIGRTLRRLELMDLPKRVMVDCSHDNCEKNHLLQATVFQSVIEQMVEGNQHIIGLALESFLAAGNQPLLSNNSISKQISITDPCLDWQSTEELILWGAKALAQTALCTAHEIV